MNTNQGSRPIEYSAPFMPNWLKNLKSLTDGNLLAVNGRLSAIRFCWLVALTSGVLLAPQSACQASAVWTTAGPIHLPEVEPAVQEDQAVEDESADTNAIDNNVVDNNAVKKFQRPFVIKFTGVIDWNNSTYIHNRIQRAKAAKADLLIIQIDSPGGLVIESERIANTLRDIDWAYTVAFVPRQALSGAALVSFGCDEIVIDSKAIFGDIGAIIFDPNEGVFRLVPAKPQSELVANASTVAESKGHSTEIVEAMIDKEVILFAGTGDNAGQFKTARFTATLTTIDAVAKEAGIDQTEWIPVEESGAERFLTFNGARAVELGFSSTNCSDVKELVSHLKSAPVRKTFEYNTSDAVVYILNNPLITGLLVVIGIIALYIEFSAPGIGGGGLIALLCAALFFWSRFMGGTSGALEVVLFVCGVVFILMEIFVIPGWGISGFAGLALMLASGVMAGMDFVVPQTSAQWNQVITNVLLILCSSVIGLISLSMFAKKIGSIPIFNRLMLDPKANQIDDGESDKASDKPAQPNHPLVSVGDWGVAESILRPAGRARFHHESVDVVSEGSFINPGDQVKVMEISGNRIVVAKVDDLDKTTAGPA